MPTHLFTGANRANPSNAGSWAVAATWDASRFVGDTGLVTVAADAGGFPAVFIDIMGSPPDNGAIPDDAVVTTITSRFDWAVTIPAGNSLQVINRQGSAYTTQTGNATGSATATHIGSASWADYKASQFCGWALARDGTAQTGGAVRIVVTNFEIEVDYTPVDRRVIRVSPHTGSFAGGETVTITGVGLAAATSVLFDNVPAVSFVIVSDTTITAVVPPHASGAVDVTVGGVGVGTALYTYALPARLLPPIPILSPMVES